MSDLPTAVIVLLALLPVAALTVVLVKWRSAGPRRRRRQQRYPAAETLARWTVDAELWRAWRAFEPSLDAEQPERDRRPNELHLHRFPRDGFDVVCGRTFVDVDGEVFGIPLRGSPEVQHAILNDARVRPSYLELSLKYPGTGTGLSQTRYTVLRIPVAPEALGDARKAAAHFNRDTPQETDFFHGPGDGSDPEDLSTCWSCGYRTYKYNSQCPRCGAALQSRRWSRRFGAILVCCGLFISALMGAVLYNVAPMLLHPGREIGGRRFSGSGLQALVVFTILASVFAFGAGTLAYGVYQVRTGQRHKQAVKILIWIVAGVVAVSGLLFLLTGED